MSAKADFILANEVTLMGRRLLQIARAKQGQRSYDLRDKTCDLSGIARATVDGELLGRDLVREVKHFDKTRSYVLTLKGKQVAQDIENRVRG